MAKLNEQARYLIKDAGDGDKKILHLFMAWLTEEGEIKNAWSTNRLGTNEGWRKDHDHFIDSAIETLERSRIGY